MTEPASTPQTLQEYRDAAHDSREAMHIEVAALRSEVAELTRSVKGLVEAWNTAGTMVGFVRNTAKLVTIIAAAVTVVVVAIKSLAHHP